MVITYNKGKDQPGKVANPTRGQLNREIDFPCPRSRLIIWSRETSSAVPPRVNLLILHIQAESGACVFFCVFSSHPFWTSSSLDVPAGVTQEEGHTGFLIHLPSAVRALIFVARRIQPFLSLVDREVEFCVLTN